ncbi:ATP-binding cassette domain-containing protein [Aureibaculum sp. 2210JD6-5]|uniref:ATP-binding cassette domain-containing protein n=1 Tax=Aureibaculum sp. 2210JD6-5 TaxID=3103957 RepID=UPI002AADA3FA|nr:ATP-binding cassette domain-containing protein [Aureibaculum sp. 2210JD6-5]MDY7395488.1 ATP-binding cassette domain-containing protein [Aureibaculum sp. 2210JD6-5]
MSKEHFSILLNNKVNKKDLVEKILSGNAKGKLKIFNKSKGLLFSDIAIADFIEVEHKHHTIEITKSENRQLNTFSSGERRKAFLMYCLDQNPDYIIFDNPFDHLDHESRLDLANQLLELSNSISIIQLSNRKESFLPFIENRWFISDNSFVLSEIPRKNKSAVSILKSDIPDSLLSFKDEHNSIVKLDKVSVSYDGKIIVKDITWTVKKGEFWQLIGPNGSGKSTILSLITGDNPKAYGQNIIIFDKKKGSGESIWDIKKKIGHFSTNLTELFKRNHTVEQMILSGFYDSIGLYHEPSDLQQRKTAQWLDIINMSQLKNTYFNRLTLGQQRLILIVRALVKQPPLLILDEPVEGLDQENTDLVIQLINTLIEKTDITILYVSHTIEASLAPTNIYELVPTENGSKGQVKM